MTDIIDDLLLAADMAEDFSGAGEGNLYLRAIAELRKKDIIRLIDRGSWKHSWHLDKDSYGEIDWASPANIENFANLISNAEEELKQLVTKINNAKTALEIIRATYCE